MTKKSDLIKKKNKKNKTVDEQDVAGFNCYKCWKKTQTPPSLLYST